jgi:hypothetical protein
MKHRIWVKKNKGSLGKSNCNNNNKKKKKKMIKIDFKHRAECKK